MNTTTAKFERDGLPTAVLDAREAAAYLAVSIDTVRRLDDDLLARFGEAYVGLVGNRGRAEALRERLARVGDR